ncbi:MAG: replication-relaxation family protein [Acidimicrobiales bacterium]
MTRSYLNLSRLSALADTLSSRDLDVVATLAKVRLATTGQLERLHFPPNGSSATASRRCRAALKRLVELGVLTRYDRRIGGVQSGSASTALTLGVAGQRLNGNRGPAGRGAVQRPWTPSSPFLAHGLAVTEIYVQLVEAQRAGRVELVQFDAEPATWRRFISPTGRSSVLRPDAFVITAAGKWEEHRFLEVDRGTRSLPSIGGQLRTYCQYWATGQEQRQHGVFPGVLFIVPDAVRKKNIERACRHLPPEAQQLFEVVVWTDALATLIGGRP